MSMDIIARGLAVKNKNDIQTNSTQIASLTNNGQINGMQIKTQEEYDALPATKETDGVIYLIRG